MSLTIFGIGSALIVLGFSFKVLQVTNKFTDIKNKEAKNKLQQIGAMSIVTGFLIALVALGMAAAERNLMIIAGANIVCIGISTLIQVALTAKNEKVIGWAAYSVVGAGLLMCLIYELVNIF
jgi:hypothetical protein